MIDDTYSAKIQFAEEPATIGCTCSNCDWTGTADKLEPIGDAILTPGDPSPAGRCPDCDCLAYVDTPAPAPALYCRKGDLDYVLTTGDGALYVVKGAKPFTDWVPLFTGSSPK